MPISIPIEFLVEPRLVSFEAARHALGLSRTTFWKERSLGKIKPVSYNRVPVSELDRYTSEEMKKSGITPARANSNV